MTTTVIVKANHGWPVRVTPVDPNTTMELPTQEVIVPRNEERTFHVHSGQDLHIHEIQPEEQS